MPPNQSSFIPKIKTTPKPDYAVRRISLPILSIICYAIFVASLIAAGAIFVYHQYTSKQLQQTLRSTEVKIQSFSIADMQSLIFFSNRLALAQSLLDSHVSLSRILLVIQEYMVTSLQVDSFSLERINHQQVRVNFDVTSPNFDTILFQRDLLLGLERQGISGVVLEDVTYVPAQAAESGSTSEYVTFSMTLKLDSTFFLHQRRSQSVGEGTEQFNDTL